MIQASSAAAEDRAPQLVQLDRASTILDLIGHTPLIDVTAAAR